MADTKMVDAGSSGGIKEAGTKEPIFSLAWDCDDLIRECLFYSKVDESTKVRMEDYERRFNAWWEYLGVFAERKGNLDYRLIHQPEIRDIVLRLLLILKRNLTELKVCQKSNGSSYVPPQRVDPAPGPKNAEDVMDIDDLQSLMALCLDAIDESLVELGQVGMAIRQSSRTTEIVRARRFASEHQDLSSFEALTFLALETLYPNAPESLITQLSRNMVDRHSRLLLRASRHNALKKDIRRHAPNLATDDSLAPSGSRPNVDNLQYAQRIDTTSQSFNIAETQYIVPPTIAPTSLYLDKFHRKLNEPQAPRSRMGTTVILQRTPEPPVPHFDGNGEAQCRWCFSNIRQNLVKDGRWSSLGR
ncbi:hypothetical protein FQN49_005573 [Arthroderma sp. PD_2]|nr:hypothetical protein FQN49_005573 [Arthroderma sp. PD_2]